jgi:DnaJ-domain-containing protein 1
LFLHFLEDIEHKRSFLELAHLVAAADGFVNRNERNYLRAYMEELELPQAETNFEPGRRLEEIIGHLQDDQVKNIFFAEILLLTFADGDYNDDEQVIVQEMRRIFGISDAANEAFKKWAIQMDQLKVEGMKLILTAH